MEYNSQQMVRMMKIQEIITRAMSKQMTWIEASEIIGISYRSMKRWKARYKENGYDGLFDRRRKSPSPKRAPVKDVETILSLYRNQYHGFNVVHFREKLVEKHGLKYSYTFIRKLLQTAGLIILSKPRKIHRKRRDRKPMVGMMLHIDGSPHAWLGGRKLYDLLVLMDDATNEIYEMELVEEESTMSCMKLLRRCVEKRGIFCSLYSDRASHFFFTPSRGDKVQKGHFTQIGRALNELNIQMIPSYSPQARGRSERMNATIQGRLVNELKLHQITSLDEANLFIQKTYIREHNQRFKVQPIQKGTAFIPLSNSIDLNLIFSIKENRIVSLDNIVQYQNLNLQLLPTVLRTSFAKCQVCVHQHLDHSISVVYGPHLIARFNAQGHHLSIQHQKRRIA